MNYRFADFVVEIPDGEYNRFPKFAEQYITEDEKTDITLDASLEEITNEASLVKRRHKKTAYYNSAVHRKFSEWLPLHNAFLLHSVVFDIDGVGVAFAAHSGTGKTTHTMLWQQLLGDKMTIVNGDKPIIRFFDEPENLPVDTEIGIPYAYGNPWNGKEHLGCDMRTVLKHICFIERSETNFVEKISADDAVDRIFKQVYMPQTPEAIANTMQMINRLINCCDLWIIHCNMDISAAETAYKEIFK